MRVLQFLTHLNVGGIPTYVYNLTKYLLANGIEVAVASSGGEWEEEFKRLGVKTYRLPIKAKSELSLKVFLSALDLAKIHKDFAFDIIHSHTRVTQVAAQLYSNFSGIPHIANFHGFYEKNKKRVGRRIFKAYGNLAIAITPETGQTLIECFKVPQNKVRVILSAIDFTRLNDLSKPLPLSGGLRIGASGRLSSVKGFHYLIEAMPQIIRRHPDAFLYIMGKGPQEQELVQKAIDLNIFNRLVIIKDQPLSSFLRSVNIFCLPSLEEPLGLSVLEAQYFGLPCVVSDAGGLKILVEDGVSGMIVPRADAQAIAEAIDRLASDEALRKTISTNCRKNVLENFDLSRKVEEFIKVYREVLE